MALLFSLLLSSALPAQADYAVIRRVSGEVAVKALGHQNFTPAQAGSGLIAGDTIRTAAKAVAQLRLEGGSIVLVAGGSTVVLGGEPEDPILEFSVGEWLFGLAKRLGKRRIRVSTPQAVAAVRGTVFWGKTDAKETLLAGLESQVEVTAAGKSVLLGPGRLVKVSAGAAPQAPVPHEVPLPFLDRFKVDGSLAGIDGILKKANKKQPK